MSGLGPVLVWEGFGEAVFVTESEAEEKGWGAPAEGRKIYEMIGGRYLFVSTLACNKTQGFLALPP